MPTILGEDVINRIKDILPDLQLLDIVDQISCINEIKLLLHQTGPMREQPVDCVLWVDANSVTANDYNPNTVAPPEMRLLEHSVEEDGYTQPIVTFIEDGEHIVVDGFHRNRVGKECKNIRDKIHGYLPVTIINPDRSDRSDRIASTIRHNRARGKHTVDGMSDIVLELSRRNWSDSKIAKELGMEADEVLRLKQITGLADLFADEEFSEAWE